MIDKILYVNDCEIVIYYADGRVVVVSSDRGEALELLNSLYDCEVQSAA